MRVIIFDEKKYAETILKNIKNSFMVKQRDLNILTRYYHYLDFNKIETREKLIEYAINVDDTFNEIIGDRSLDFALRYYGRNELRAGEPIVICANEIEKIHTIKSIKEQKVIFIMLVISKIFNKSKDADYYYNGSLSDVFRLARLSNSPKTERIDIIHNLSKNKYIEPNLHGGYKICLTDKDRVCGIGDIIIEDFDNMADKFPAICSICGERIEGKPKRRTYCDECYNKKRRNDIKNNVSKFRSGSKDDM